jgi:hypothetical protein
MLFPNFITEQIAKTAYWADRSIRADLADGLITTENDYTSNFTAAFRRGINARGIPSLHATSYVLMPAFEREVGADACIILASDSQYKVCLFEAKWPRLSSHADCWDSRQRRTGQSHFADQLNRQSIYSKEYAIWEMFYCEFPFGKQPSFFPKNVSGCVWHGDAMEFSNARVTTGDPWTDIELSSLLTGRCKHIDQIIREVCECGRGKIFTGRNYPQGFDGLGRPAEMLLIKYTNQELRDA